MHGNTTRRVGIIGDGQLALMLADSLQKLSIPFLCLKQSPQSPMERTFPGESTFDQELFISKCDVFTLENEFLKVEELGKLLGDKADRLFPDLESYRHFADKISQRTLFDQLGLRSPNWMPVRSSADLKEVRNRFAFPFVLKASAGGYDGKGVKIIRNEEDLQEGLAQFGLNEGREALVEEMVKIKREVARGFIHQKSGPASFLPLVDTIQENGVCNFVYYPAQVSPKVEAEVEVMIQKLINAPLNGIFNFEFFVDQDDLVYVNEGAPRPHNSQHLTIDASSHSQFDLLALHLVGAEVPRTVETHPSVMVNLLGQSTGPGYELQLPRVEGVEVKPKLYGKEKCSPGRKMGHVNIVDPLGHNDLRSIATKIFGEYRL